MFRRRGGTVEVLLAHPGGPFWARRDEASWTLPKGEIGPDEDPLAAKPAARRIPRRDRLRRHTTLPAAGRAAPEERQAHHGLGLRGRCRSDATGEQFVRAGMAAPLRPHAILSGSRPPRVVRLRYGAAQADRRPGALRGRAGAVAAARRYAAAGRAIRRRRKPAAARCVFAPRSRCPAPVLRRLPRRRSPASPAQRAPRQRAWPAWLRRWSASSRP